MSVIIPVNQSSYNDPYQQRLFDFGLEDSRVYLSRSVNQLLKSVGNNIVLNGFEITDISFTDTNITIDISSGIAIVDMTLVEIRDPVSITFEAANSYDTNGKFVLHVNYEFLETVQSNPAKIKLSYISSDGNTILPDGWYVNKDNIVLAIVEFSKDGEDHITRAFEFLGNSVLINGSDYYGCGYDESTLQHRLHDRLNYLTDENTGQKYRLFVKSGNLSIKPV